MVSFGGEGRLETQELIYLFSSLFIWLQYFSDPGCGPVLCLYQIIAASFKLDLVIFFSEIFFNVIQILVPL